MTPAIPVMRILAYVIADSLLEELTREELVIAAAERGVSLINPEMTDEQIRTVIRRHAADKARRDGLPVDDLPTLTAAEGRDLGRRLAGGGPRPQAAPGGTRPPTQPRLDPDLTDDA
ncbi:hypothetical protein [Plantactinospora sp. CA-290183]|uniref:hypothetical protein n=1 Tax=Plantactinospora sp. CA-290183 TaxID=3240006 RepID=UPI003D93EA1B